MNREYVNVMWSPVNGVLFAEIVDCVGCSMWASMFWITHNNVKLYIRSAA